MSGIFVWLMIGIFVQATVSLFADDIIKHVQSNLSQEENNLFNTACEEGKTNPIREGVIGTILWPLVLLGVYKLWRGKK